ncbi:MAG: class I SAM-dependent methyltransferase [Deltaproteobacteria bacterium]|nr:class I SAM-dependent methyltransferase [Deltaproteobacteria bacterium]
MVTFRDFRVPYSALQAWAYDRLIAPAAVEIEAALAAELFAEVTERASLLEVGCGGGQLGLRLGTRHQELRWTGVDLSPDQVRRARRRTAPLGERAHVVQASALALPFEDACFDAVLSIASIKHWPAPERGLGECARVLRPGGVLVVGEADRGCSYEDVRRFVSRWGIPGWLQPPAHAFFRTLVAGHSFDLDGARALLASVPVDGSVERVPDVPAWIIKGRKRAQPAASHDHPATP